jgi:hypothetical protein
LNRNAFLAALAAGILCCVCAVYAVTAPDLMVRLDGDFLHVSAPRLNFLSGKPLERLKDGASVAFVAQLTISSERNSLAADARTVARFALSYDVWGEKFSVVKIGDRLESHRVAASHLSTVEATQNWCLDNLTIEQSSIPADRPFYVHLDLRIEDPRDQLGIVGEGGISISRLIEVFSRPGKASQAPWLRTEGPFRLSELRKASRG